MNALDVYDFDDQVTPAQPAPEAAPPATGGPALTSASPTSSPTLNEEVQQVMGTLGGFWGSFRKQVFRIDPSTGKAIDPPRRAWLSFKPLGRT